MGVTDFGQIFIGVAISVVAFIIIAFITWFVKEWKKIEKRRLIYYMKIDCMIEALSSIDDELPTGIGLRFKAVYQSLFAEKLKEYDLIEK